MGNTRHQHHTDPDTSSVAYQGQMNLPFSVCLHFCNSETCLVTHKPNLEDRSRVFHVSPLPIPILAIPLHFGERTMTIAVLVLGLKAGLLVWSPAPPRNAGSLQDHRVFSISGTFDAAHSLLREVCDSKFLEWTFD